MWCASARCVSPSRSGGKGIGRALIQRVKDWAIEQDAQDLRLTVWPFNERAVRMYAEFGFETRALEMGVRL